MSLPPATLLGPSFLGLPQNQQQCVSLLLSSSQCLLSTYYVLDVVGPRPPLLDGESLLRGGWVSGHLPQQLGEAWARGTYSKASCRAHAFPRLPLASALPVTKHSQSRVLVTQFPPPGAPFPTPAHLLLHDCGSPAPPPSVSHLRGQSVWSTLPLA